MKYLILMFFVLTSSQISLASADAESKRGYFYDKAGVITKGTDIYITEYDPRLDGVFEVQTKSDYGSNSYYTRIRDLMKSSSKIKNGNYKRRPRSLQDKSFHLEEDLVIYTYPIDID